MYIDKPLVKTRRDTANFDSPMAEFDLLLMDTKTIESLYGSQQEGRVQDVYFFTCKTTTYDYELLALQGPAKEFKTMEAQEFEADTDTSSSTAQHEEPLLPPSCSASQHGCRSASTPQFREARWRSTLPQDRQKDNLAQQCHREFVMSSTSILPEINLQ